MFRTVGHSRDALRVRFSAERRVGLRLAVIVDDGRLQRFALEALDAVTLADSITVYSCTNTLLRRRLFRHGAYYGLNLLTVRNRMTQFVGIASGKKRILRTTPFEALSDGGWQTLPPEIADELRAFDVVLKFGMGLLRVPDRLTTPILSYHHGDPDQFRGRPAAFWEMTQNVPTLGQVVQVIGNRLDAGKVVAFAETKVYRWSYRATLIEAYRHSPLIIDTAIRNAIAGTYIDKASDGRNWRLPSNHVVLRFVTRMAWNAARRLLYGAFGEKGWRVSTATRSPGLLQGELPAQDDWQTLPIAAGYSFYADPFFTDDAVLVEALRTSNRLGEIVRIDGDRHHPLLSEPGHMSYPAVTTIGGRQVIVPEIASWSKPRVYSKDGDLVCHLQVENGAQVSDPTLLEREGRLYLFGNDRRDGSNVLTLWSSGSLEEEFKRHAASPIRLSPRGARMGGNIISENGRLYRLGQDFSGDYGDGLIVFEIEELSAEAYAETEIGRIRFEDRKGPHTLNIRGEEIIFDWYRDRFAPLAGVRRVLQRRRRPQATQ